MRKLISPECIHKFKIYVVCGWDQIDISIISVILVISVISVIPLPPPPGNGGGNSWVVGGTGGCGKNRDRAKQSRGIAFSRSQDSIRFWSISRTHIA